jgi:hypothetical protein
MEENETIYYKIDEVVSYHTIYNSLLGLIGNFKIDDNIVYYHLICKTIDSNYIKLVGIVETRKIIYHSLLQCISAYDKMIFIDYINEFCETENNIIYDVCSDVDHVERINNNNGINETIVNSKLKIFKKNKKN